RCPDSGSLNRPAADWLLSPGPEDHMRFLRNRSIATKLGASAACALLLVVALAWSAQRGIATLGHAQNDVSSAAVAERQMKDALVAAQELRVIGRVIAEAQTSRELTKALAAAKTAE